MSSTMALSVESRVQSKNGPRNKKVNKISNSVVHRNSDRQNVLHSPPSVATISTSTTTESEISKTVQYDDTITCWICAEPVKYFSISQCNHRTCHVCALRLRVLYKKLDCTFCKHPQDIVIFTESPDKLFIDFGPQSMLHKDLKLSVYFETKEMMEEALILLRFNCPDSQCPYVATGWEDLKVHARDVHARKMCDICIRSKKVFAHEHTLYTANQLYHHLPSMLHRSNKPISKDKIEGGIHPLCEFCRECFFGDDELYSHMRERHEECFVCKRNGVRDQYFLNYDNLEKHFHQAHHSCMVPSCLSRKFVVFGSTIDLQAHMVEEHGSSMSSKDRKDIRRVATEFDFEEAGDAPGRRRRNRTRDNELSPRTSTLEDSRRREGFGSALTAPAASTSNVSAASSFSSHLMQNLSLSGEATDPAAAQYHGTFMSRLSSVAPNSASAIASIKAALQSLRASESTARDLISTCYNALGMDLEKTGSVVVACVDELEDEDKRKDILAAWNGFKIEYRRGSPDLTADSTGSAYAGVTSGRVLNVKHSTTARSSQQSTTQVWDRVARAATSSLTPTPSTRSSGRSTELFPALNVSSLPSVSSTGSRRSQHSTPWASASASRASNITASSAGIPEVNSQKKEKVNSAGFPALSNSSFPMLPSSSTSRSKPVVSGNQSLRNIIGLSAPPAAWNSISREQESSIANDEQEPLEGPADSNAGRGKKKKGKEKHTLFTIGTFPS